MLSGDIALLTHRCSRYQDPESLSSPSAKVPPLLAGRAEAVQRFSHYFPEMVSCNVISAKSKNSRASINSSSLSQ